MRQSFLSRGSAKAAEQVPGADAPTPSRVDMTLDSVAAWIQQAQDRFDAATRAAVEAHERSAQTVDGAIGDFGERLSKIERRAADPMPSSVEGALKAIERLETRLDDGPAPSPADATIETVLHGFERRIARLAQDLGTSGRPIGRRPLKGADNLNAAVAEIRTRQARLDADPQSLPPQRTSPEVHRLQSDLAASLRGDIAGLAARMDAAHAPEQAAIGRLHDDLDTIRGSIEGLATRDHVASVEQAVSALSSGLADVHAPSSAMSELAAEIESLHNAMENLTAAQAPRDDDRIRADIEQLSGKIDALAARDVGEDRPQGLVDLGKVEILLQGLAERVDGIDSGPALNQLERQIAKLVDRLALVPSGDAGLERMERTMTGLLDEVVSWRERATEIAERAAQAAVADLHGGDTTDLARDFEAFRLRCDTSDKRHQDSLAAVTRSLVDVTSRLDGLAHPAADTPSAGPTDAAVVDPASVEQAPVRSERLADMGAMGAMANMGDAEARDAALLQDADRPIKFDEEVLLEPGAARPVVGHAAAGDSAVRSDFIAAARRAAKAAATEAAASRKPARPAAPMAGEPAAPASPGALANRIRMLVDRHRRPLLISAAALVLALGTLQLLRTAGPTDGDASVTAAAPVVALRPQDKPAERTAGGEGAGNASADAKSSAEAKLPVDPKIINDPTTTQSIAAAPPAVPGSGPNLPILPPSSDAAQPIAPPAQASAPILAVPPPSPPAAADANVLPAGLKAAALTGNPVAGYEYAIRLADGRGVPKDAALAVKFFEKAAEKGIAPAQYRLGNIYEKGLGVTRDLDTAKTWYKRAAEHGNARAMHNLAVLLADGAGGKPDFAAAASWFEKGAQQGVRDSQYNYAVLLARGLGGPQDLVGSYTWFAIAALAGDTDAGNKRDEIGVKLAPADLAKGKAAAARWHPATPTAGANDVQLPPGGFAIPKATASAAGKPTARDGRV